MRTKHALAVIAAACLCANAASADQAGIQQRLGKFIALPAMANFCHLTLTPEQSAEWDKIAPKLQKDAGLSDDEAEKVVKQVDTELAKSMKPDDCAGIAAHWQETVPALLAQAKPEP